MNDSTAETDSNRFLTALAASGLIAPARLSDLRVMPDGLAERLVAEGELTPFQARKLKAGTWQGLVLGPYHLLVPIGRGGMGTVYLARDSRDARLAALKVLPPKRARAEERMLTRFQREMQFSMQVDHPVLTRTFETGVHEKVHYIAMEYIPGQSLYGLVKESGPLTAGRAARLFSQVADGLDYAHSQGLVHRDLKPSNIMITHQDKARVLDFGLALIEGEIVTDASVVGGQGYVVGSMDYIAPEQTTDASAVDGRADLYSLGCSLYYSLTGKPPFSGGTSHEKMERHRENAPRPITELNPAVPAELADLIHRLLSKEPSHRPASAKAVQSALEKFADNLPLAKPGTDPVNLADLEAHSAEFELVEVDTKEEKTETDASFYWVIGIGLSIGFAASLIAYRMFR